MMEDMQMRQSDRARKEQAFHGNDDAITIDDLWEAWFESKERAWSIEEVNILTFLYFANKKFLWFTGR